MDTNQALEALYPSMAPAPVDTPAVPATMPDERGAAAILYGAPPSPAAKSQPLAVQEGSTAAGLYDPMGDGVVYGEQPLRDAAAVQIDLPQDVAGQLGADELPQVKAALIAAEVGHTLAGSFIQQATVAMRNPITTTPEQAETALRQKFGSSADAKLAAARGMIEKAAERWPAVWDFLDRTGLGNSPRLIEQLAARAARRTRTRT